MKHVKQKDAVGIATAHCTLVEEEKGNAIKKMCGKKWCLASNRNRQKKSKQRFHRDLDQHLAG